MRSAETSGVEEEGFGPVVEPPNRRSIGSLLRALPPAALATITPHRVRRVGKTVERRAGQACHDKPEQRGKHCVAAVLQDGFGGGAGHFGLIQFAGLATDQIANTFASLVQIALSAVLGKTALHGCDSQKVNCVTADYLNGRKVGDVLHLHLWCLRFAVF